MAERQWFSGWRIVFCAAVAVFVAAAALLGCMLFSYWQGQKSYDDLAASALGASVRDVDAAPDALLNLQVDWDALSAENPDTVGWICIPGTAVNYPVVRAPENDPERYLTYDFHGNAGGWWMPTYGTPYLLAGNAADFSDRNNVVQGHHLQNGEMFAALADFADSACFNEHRSVYLLTPQGNYRLLTLALVHCEGSEPIVQTAFSTEEDFEAYVQDKLDRSVVSADPAPPAATEVSQLFTFSTCDNGTDMRYVLFCSPAEYVPAGDLAADGTVAGAGSGAAGAAAGASASAQAAVNDASKESVS